MIKYGDNRETKLLTQALLYEDFVCIVESIPSCHGWTIEAETSHRKSRRLSNETLPEHYPIQRKLHGLRSATGIVVQ
jgi:hypothetical protein